MERTQSYQDDQNQKRRIVSEIAAYSIGGSIRSRDITEVIDISNRDGHLFHAVRLNQITLLDPNQPTPLLPQEDGKSLWCTGTRIFSQTPDIGGTSQYRDTPFFEYGSYIDEEGNARMDIAVTNQTLIKEIPKGYMRVRTNENTQIPIEAPVPSSLVHILSVQVNKNNCLNNPRQLTQIAEQQMFHLIENALTYGYKPGEQTIVRI